MVVKTAKRSVYSSSHKGRRNGLALSFDADRGGGKRRGIHCGIPACLAWTDGHGTEP